MAQPVDFVGLNTFIYDPCGYDATSVGTGSALVLTERHAFGGGGFSSYLWQVEQNTMGGVFRSQVLGSINYLYADPSIHKNWKFSNANNVKLDDTNYAPYFPALILHRHGPYGWPTWRQTRVGQNYLIRKQRRHNIFTYIEEPGDDINYATQNSSSVSFRARRSDIKKFIEDPLTTKYSPLRLVGTIINEEQEKNMEEVKVSLAEVKSDLKIIVEFIKSFKNGK